MKPEQALCLIPEVDDDDDKSAINEKKIRNEKSKIKEYPILLLKFKNTLKYKIYLKSSESFFFHNLPHQ